jgi:hypothetical protein
MILDMENFVIILLSICGIILQRFYYLISSDVSQRGDRPHSLQGGTQRMLQVRRGGFAIVVFVGCVFILQFWC